MCARRAASPVVSCCAICRKNGSGRGPCCSATRVGVSLELSRLSDELMTDARPESDPVIIKKYANRRLSHTHTSSSFPLQHLPAPTPHPRASPVPAANGGDPLPHPVPTSAPPPPHPPPP